MTIRICCISDTHGLHNQVTIEPCDILLHGGDVSNIGERYDVSDFISWMERQPALHKVFIAGNHDRSFEGIKPYWLEDELSHMSSNIHYLQDSGVEIMGIKIWGTPWQPEFYNWAFNLPRGEKLAEKYALIPWDTDILISHGPPYGIEDSIPDHFLQPGQTDLHVGCKDLLGYIQSEQKDLDYHIFGHIHLDGRKDIKPVEVKIKNEINHGDRDHSITCINAAVVDNRYKVIVKPYYFNYEI